MIFQIAITIVLSIAVIGLLVWFFNAKDTLSKTHNHYILTLENAISITRFQLNFRNENLNRYDFQKYNLEEALVVQPEIILMESYNDI
ncbi:hypothetical protein QRD02_08280 [Aequorivita sp. SDUM287046]|uniref:Sensor histidine kinase n=1 Tax=Aequorivita aurantiaca TaxID=3053356 RepID=A0ABT8DHL5_9FLAO|nr:hypothetical protein [Aequorivita aurantiaca]MDN3724377.1 hypothetical protein [Aequorivita aurantiaca]